MFAADSRSGTISPTPAPVNGTDSATMRNTSAKRQRDQREVRALEAVAERQCADEDADPGARRQRQRHGEPGVQAGWTCAMACT